MTYLALLATLHDLPTHLRPAWFSGTRFPVHFGQFISFKLNDSTYFFEIAFDTVFLFSSNRLHQPPTGPEIKVLVAFLNFRSKNLTSHISLMTTAIHFYRWNTVQHKKIRKMKDASMWSHTKQTKRRIACSVHYCMTRVWFGQTLPKCDYNLHHLGFHSNILHIFSSKMMTCATPRQSWWVPVISDIFTKSKNSTSVWTYFTHSSYITIQYTIQYAQNTNTWLPHYHWSSPHWRLHAVVTPHSHLCNRAPLPRVPLV